MKPSKFKNELIKTVERMTLKPKKTDKAKVKVKIKAVGISKDADAVAKGVNKAIEKAMSKKKCNNKEKQLIADAKLSRKELTKATDKHIKKDIKDKLHTNQKEYVNAKKEHAHAYVNNTFSNNYQGMSRRMMVIIALAYIASTNVTRKSPECKLEMDISELYPYDLSGRRHIGEYYGFAPEVVNHMLNDKSDLFGATIAKLVYTRMYYNYFKIFEGNSLIAGDKAVKFKNIHSAINMRMTLEKMSDEEFDKKYNSVKALNDLFKASANTSCCI